MAEPRPWVWRVGAGWEDFTSYLRSHPSLVITENGSIRLLDLSAGWQMRVSPDGGHSMDGDFVQRPLSRVRFASPCGVHTEGSDPMDWHVTTRVLAVGPIRIAQGPLTETIQALIEDRALDRLTNHASQRCPVAYCGFEGE